MAYYSEPSSSLSFTSSPASNGSNTQTMSNYDALPNLEVISFTKLSSNLENLLIDPSCDYSDAEIVVQGIPVGVHRCILAARSSFFRELFKQETENEGKPKYCMNDLLPYGNVGYDAFLIFLSYLYTAKLKPTPIEVSTCVDSVCAHDACRPAISFVVELLYASFIFEVSELVSLFQRRLLNFVDKANIEDVIPILVVAFHCQANQLIAQCTDRIARSCIDNVSIEKELPHEVSENIKSLRKKPILDDDDDEENAETIDPLHEKRVKRILRALDSDDVELVKLLLTESHVTLDDAYALHYAAAYCDPKVVSEILALGLADINLRNSQGYTVLHVAAMRRLPSVIVSLLSKGACALDVTLDGRSAVSICRRLTRHKDYHARTEQGQEANKNRLCIDVLEREMRRNPMVGGSSIVNHALSDDIHMKLLYLENRVAFARLFFPTEAKLAMDIANAETTHEFAGISASKGSNGNLREVDLNETPANRNKRLHSRLEALMKTVEMGRRYFPNCSEVLDKFMEDDLPDLFYLEQGTPHEQRLKRTRFMELKEDVQKAFSKDKAECSVLCSSPSPRNGARNKPRKL